MRAISSILLAYALAVPAYAELPAGLPADLPEAFAKRIEQAAGDCKSLAEGELTVGPAAISRPDLNGDGTPDWALNEGEYLCGGVSSPFCGSGGCVTAFLIDGVSSEIFGHGWELMTDQTPPVLRTHISGIECNGPQALSCRQDQIWQEGAWRPLGPPEADAPEAEAHSEDGSDQPAP